MMLAPAAATALASSTSWRGIAAALDLEAAQAQHRLRGQAQVRRPESRARPGSG